MDAIYGHHQWTYLRVCVCVCVFVYMKFLRMIFYMHTLYDLSMSLMDAINGAIIGRC
jgi:hypothetical protein